jgi:hypothetical protein
MYSTSFEFVHYFRQRNSVHQKQEYTGYSYWQPSQDRGTHQDKYGQWSSQARQQEESYRQWARQRRKNNHSHYHHQTFDQQKFSKMLGPFAFLMDAFLEQKQSSEATFQDIFVVFTLINVFTFFMCLSGIYMMKEIAYITRKR